MEEHFVRTRDGWILRLFRVPRGRAPPPDEAARAAGVAAAAPRRRARARPVVHLQHGLLGAASDWALNGPGFSLAFLLADAGAAAGALALPRPRRPQTRACAAPPPLPPPPPRQHVPPPRLRRVARKCARQRVLAQPQRAVTG